MRGCDAEVQAEDHTELPAEAELGSDPGALPPEGCSTAAC